PTLKPAKKLWQPSQVYGGTDVEQGQQYLPREFFESITGHAACNQSIIMRPDRTVVIRERIVASLSGCNRTHSPAIKKIRMQHFARQTGSDYWGSNPGIEALSGVGGTNAARRFVAIQSQSIYRKIVTPECVVKTSLQLVCLGVEAVRSLVVSHASGYAGRREFGCVLLPLHIAQRDGRFSKRSVCMKDGIIRIFPPLLHQTLPRMLRVLNKAVAIAVAVFIHPFEGKVNVRPQVPHEFNVGGAVKVCSGQHNEEGSGINAAVVFAERHFLQRGHFSTAHFMQNFSWLGFNLGAQFGGLRLGEKLQNALRDPGTGP